MLKRQGWTVDTAGHRLWCGRLPLRTAVTLTVAVGSALLSQYIVVSAARAASPTSSAVFKAIDPSTAQMDELPPTDSAASAGKSNPFNAPIQGQPLKGVKPQSGANSAAPAQSDSAQSGDAGFGAETPSIDATPEQEGRITNLEQKAFGSNYSEHEVGDRLDHLEKETFGSTKSGDINSRIAALETKLLGGSAFGGGIAAPGRPQSNYQYPASGSYPAPTQTSIQPPSQQPSQQPSQPVGQSQWIVPGQSQSGQYQAPAQQYQAPPVAVQPPAQYQNPAPGPSSQPPYRPPAQYQQPAAYQPSGYQQQPPAQSYQQQPPAQSYQQPPAQSYQQQPPAQSYQQPPAQSYGQQQPPAQGGYQQQPYRPYQPAQPSQPLQPGYPSGGGQYTPPQTPSPGGLALDAMVVANALSYDTASGDYLSAIKKFPAAQGGQTVAHWMTFPVKIKLPATSPDSWQRSLEAVIARWGQYVPVKMSLPKEEPNAEIIWVNTLPKGILGVTRFSIKNARLHAWVYLLRPSFYPPEISEQSLSNVFLKEMGHVLGLLGKSDKLGDLMYQTDTPTALKPGAKTGFKASNISSRDINTLKRVYESQALPDGFTLNEPLEWATNY